MDLEISLKSGFLKKLVLIHIPITWIKIKTIIY